MHQTLLQQPGSFLSINISESQVTVSANPGHSVTHVQIMYVCRLYEYLTFDWYCLLTSVPGGGLLSVQSMLCKLSLVVFLHSRLLILLGVVYI